MKTRHIVISFLVLGVSILATIFLLRHRRQMPFEMPATREEQVEVLLSAQRGNGSWGPKVRSVEITAVVIHSLIVYSRTSSFDSHAPVDMAIHKGLGWLWTQEPRRGSAEYFAACSASMLAERMVAEPVGAIENIRPQWASWSAETATPQDLSAAFVRIWFELQAGHAPIGRTQGRALRDIVNEFELLDHVCPAKIEPGLRIHLRLILAWARQGQRVGADYLRDIYAYPLEGGAATKELAYALLTECTFLWSTGGPKAWPYSRLSGLPLRQEGASRLGAQKEGETGTTSAVEIIL